MSKVTQGFKHLISCGIMVRKWMGIFGATWRCLGVKSRSLVKFEELAKGTIGESTQSAIMYRLEIWLNEKQELFLTSRRRALSRGCVREKPVSCTWELCVPGEKSHCIAWENRVLWDTGYVSQSTPSIQSWNKDTRERMEKDTQGIKNRGKS